MTPGATNRPALRAWGRAGRPEAAAQWSGQDQDAVALATHSWWLLQAALLSTPLAAQSAIGVLATQPYDQTLRNNAQQVIDQGLITPTLIIGGGILLGLLISAAALHVMTPVGLGRRQASMDTQGLASVVGVATALYAALSWGLLQLAGIPADIWHAAGLSFPIGALMISWTLQRELSVKWNNLKSGEP